MTKPKSYKTSRKDTTVDAQENQSTASGNSEGNNSEQVAKAKQQYKQIVTELGGGNWTIPPLNRRAVPNADT